MESTKCSRLITIIPLISGIIILAGFSFVQNADAAVPISDSFREKIQKGCTETYNAPNSSSAHSIIWGIQPGDYFTWKFESKSGYWEKVTWVIMEFTKNKDYVLIMKIFPEFHLCTWHNYNEYIQVLPQSSDVFYGIRPAIFTTFVDGEFILGNRADHYVKSTLSNAFESIRFISEDDAAAYYEIMYKSTSSGCQYYQELGTVCTGSKTSSRTVETYSINKKTGMLVSSYNVDSGTRISWEEYYYDVQVPEFDTIPIIIFTIGILGVIAVTTKSRIIKRS